MRQPTSRLPSLAAVALLLVLMACSDAPGEVASTPLGPPDARAAEGFTSVFAAAELPDGRVLITDNRETAIAVIDFEEGSVTRLWRRGSGPMEFQSAFTVLRFPGDTLGVYDSRGRRFTLIDGTGSIVGTRPFPSPPLRGFSAPRGPDAQGRLYIDRRIVGPNGLEREMPVYRWDPKAEELVVVDTLMTRSEAQGGRRGILPMPEADLWAVLTDGSISRVLAADYHVEWIGGEQGDAVGPPLPWDPIEVTEEERERWLVETFSAPAGSATMRGEGGDDAVPASRRREFPASAFPDRMPPFERHVLPASSERGELWIKRATPWDDTETVIDVVGRDGRLARRIRIPGDVRVVAVTDDHAYLARKDEVDLEWLERYPLD